MIIINNTNKGESILEILLALAIFSIVLPPILYTMGALASGQPQRNVFFDALVLIEDTKNTIQQLKSTDWNTVSTNGEYTLNNVNGADVLVPLIGTPTPNANGLIQTIQIESAHREGGILVDEGGVEDSATKKITIKVTWGATQDPVSTTFYAARSDTFGVYVVSSSQEFAQDSALYAGTQVVSSEPNEGEIAIGPGEPDPVISLKSWWKMTGEYSASHAEVDAAPNGANNLQIFGNPVFGSGRFGNKVALNTNSKYLVASSSASLELAGQLTLVVWVRSTNMPDNAAILHKLSPTSSGYRIGVDQEGKVSALVGDGTTTLNAKNNTKPIIDNLWHQIAVTYDGSTLLVIVDGNEGDVRGEGVNKLGQNTDPLYIGKDPTSTNRNFTGDIDDVQVYNTALTLQEVQKLLYSTYTSPIKDFGKGVLVHSLRATVTQSSNTKSKLQIAFANPLDDSCEGVYYRFVGPDGTENTFYETDQAGTTSVSSSVPGPSEDGNFVNPGRCLRFKSYLYSAAFPDTQDPSLQDVRFTYSQ